jgi:hypothetical protein
MRPSTPRAIGDELLAATLRRHVGHQVRCVRETCSAGLEGFELETVALRCEDCGEVVLEAVTTRRRRARASGRT